MRRYALALAGLTLYGVFLLVEMPAAMLAARLPADSPARMQQLEGSLWRGAARSLTYRVGGRELDLGRLAWQWAPAELWRGRLGLRFQLGPTERRLEGLFLWGSDGARLQGVRGQLDAALLGVFSPALSLLQPEGELEADIPELHWNDQRIHGGARLGWNHARSALTAAPLGQHRAELQAEPDGRQARLGIQSGPGPLTMNGEGRYTPGKGLEGRLALIPPQDAAARAPYQPLLDLIGRPDAAGIWTLRLVPR